MAHIEELETLHDLLNRAPAAELPTAKRFLDLLCGAFDEEPLSAADMAAINAARGDFRHGRTMSLDQLKAALEL